jgi:hypothetical protein
MTFGRACLMGLEGSLVSVPLQTKLIIRLCSLSFISEKTLSGWVGCLTSPTMVVYAFNISLILNIQRTTGQSDDAWQV